MYTIYEKFELPSIVILFDRFRFKQVKKNFEVTKVGVSTFRTVVTPSAVSRPSRQLVPYSQKRADVLMTVDIRVGKHTQGNLCST